MSEEFSVSDAILTRAAAVVDLTRDDHPDKTEAMRNVLLLAQFLAGYATAYFNSEPSLPENSGSLINTQMQHIAAGASCYTAELSNDLLAKALAS